jgi:hypothetical protein
MESLFDLRTRLRRYRVRHCWPSAYGFWLLVGGIASLAASATSAAETPRFQLVGSGTLQLDQPGQKSGNVLLRAYSTPTGAAFAASQPMQEGGTFSLTALLSTSSLVCYNDTIFRDGFDGTGL